MRESLPEEILKVTPTISSIRKAWGQQHRDEDEVMCIRGTELQDGNPLGDISGVMRADFSRGRDGRAVIENN